MSNPAFDLLHPAVQKAVWTMGWKEFHPIQVEAINHVLQGTNHLILSAQTAGGKTEAAFLPIISKLAANQQPSVQALYIGPLKALINDQFGRLEKLCQEIDIPVHRWHGDVTASQKKELRQSPAGILLITPESLESNFINYGVHVPRLYRHLEFVVIDELHSFMDNVRGVHLRSLLARINLAANVRPRIIGLSATLGNPELARRFVCPENPASVDLITDPNSTRDVKFGVRVFLRRAAMQSEKLIGPRLKPAAALQLSERLSATDLASQIPVNKTNAAEAAPIELQTDAPADEDLDEIADDIVLNFSQSTNLIFVNAKRTIEILAVKLHDAAKRNKLPADPFVVHHGSISKELREEAETQLKQGTPTTAICSSTLEMGIDIGSVRAVGQVDTPWSVASMVQRLGRSGRRDGDAAIMRMYIRETSPHHGSTLTDLIYPDLLRAVALTRLMLQKWLEPPDIDRLHLSTLVHQILSCLKQTGGMTAAELHSVLIKNGPFRQVTTEIFQSILKGLGEKKVLEQCPEGDLILAPMGERITSGFDFYAAFKSKDEFVIRNGDAPIGTLPADVIPPVGEHLILDGRRWLVQEIDPASKIVFVTAARGGKAPEFLSDGGSMHTRVVQEMRNVLLDNDEPVWLHPDGRLLLRAARNTAHGCGLIKTNVLVHPREIQWFPWVGTRGFETLRAFARSAGIKHEADRLSISYQLDSREHFMAHLKEIANSNVSSAELASFLSVKAIEKFDGFLPDGALNTANGHDRLNLDEAKLAAQYEISQR